MILLLNAEEAGIEPAAAALAASGFEDRGDHQISSASGAMIGADAQGVNSGVTGGAFHRILPGAVPVIRAVPRRTGREAGWLGDGGVS
jgi:hypothetical protein